jgi:hypothetical protein
MRGRASSGTAAAQALHGDAACSSAAQALHAPLGQAATGPHCSCRAGQRRGKAAVWSTRLKRRSSVRHAVLSGLQLQRCCDHAFCGPNSSQCHPNCSHQVLEGWHFVEFACSRVTELRRGLSWLANFQLGMWPSVSRARGGVTNGVGCTLVWAVLWCGVGMHLVHVTSMPPVVQLTWFQCSLTAGKALMCSRSVPVSLPNSFTVSAHRSGAHLVEGAAER